MSTLPEMLDLARPLFMGILNVTPDSFSDGGLYGEIRNALTRAQVMKQEGADLIDIGGESTRPGAERVDVATQLSRIIPVLEALIGDAELSSRLLISVDTTQSRVADVALNLGAGMINDVSAGTDDPEILDVVAAHRVPIVLMHMRGTPKTMQNNPVYNDARSEVLGYLVSRIDAAISAGIARENIILDPGIGFGKRKEDNLMLLAHLDSFVELGFPVLLGASRKRFMGAICKERQPKELLGATIATTVLGVRAGVRLFRVHDVKENRQAAFVTAAVISRHGKE
jgi:dihydropteroate synthase